MRKLIAGIVFAGAVSMPAVAFADAGGTAYGDQHGFTVSNANTTCAGHGAFSYFGKDNSMAGGANGYRTGLNNAMLCGNRQGNLP